MSKKTLAAELAPLLRGWDANSVAERITKRTGSTLQELQAFHDAFVPHLEEIIDLLNQYPVDEVPEEYRALREAALYLLHVDRPVNKWKTVMLEGARDPRSFRMKRDFTDSGVERD